MLKPKTLILLLTVLFTFSITAQQTVVFDNWNKGGVSNWPKEFTMFQLDQSVKVSQIVTYHWNNGNGSTGNEFGPYIKLFDVETSKEFGPWKATLSGGSYNSTNVTWTAYPNETIPPGIYVVKDSDPATWSYNNGSENSGFVKVLSGTNSQNSSGYSNATGTYQSSFGTLTISQNGNSISGTYTADNGKISGIMNGHIFLGTWSESPSYKGPSDAGKVQFEFSDDWTSFTGKWGYTGKPLTSNWSGKRK